MTGTLVNSAAILAGSALGIAAGKRLGEGLKTTLMQALGLSVLAVGIQMALTVTELIPAIGCVLLGAVTGEILRIEDGMAALGNRFRRLFHSSSGTFTEGFVTASILYITGAMVIIGSIEDGTTGHARVLYVKSLLDGTASVALASSLGTGVALSALSVLIVQGSITLLASKLLFLQDPAVLATITSAGGILIIGIGINLLEIRKIAVGNMIPAIVYAALWGRFFS